MYSWELEIVLPNGVSVRYIAYTIGNRNGDDIIEVSAIFSQLTQLVEKNQLVQLVLIINGKIFKYIYIYIVIEENGPGVLNYPVFYLRSLSTAEKCTITKLIGKQNKN